MRTDVFGWFDKPDQTVPTHDPGLAAPCVVCGEACRGVWDAFRPLKTISLMCVGDKRSYFFRAHKSCWDGLDSEEQGAIESSLIDELSAGNKRMIPLKDWPEQSLFRQWWWGVVGRHAFQLRHYWLWRWKLQLTGQWDKLSRKAPDEE